mmetsp:Transcript_21236/g.65788  ORF Transcript_21236/g.65788 Transcript_21236/m.65788 type:complete len:303 (-) Transcript_21236:17-925(-)
MLMEGWRFLTAIYVIVQIVTTIGYGDFTVTTEGMKFFCAIYVLLMLMAGAYIINYLVDGVTAKNADFLTGQLQSFETALVRCDTESQLDAREATKRAAKYKKYNPVIAASASMAFSVFLGTAFYGYYEACACSYGKSHVQGCLDETYEQCVKTGGYQKTWMTSFYMSVITLTTVGFGDEVPSTAADRVFATFWMLFGVASMANFLAELAHAILLSSMETMSRNGMSHELFKKIDQDGSGTLTKFEFTTFMLVKYGLVSEEDLDLLILEFEKFDRDGNGELEYEEIIAGDEQPRRHSHAPMLQ